MISLPNPKPLVQYGSREHYKKVFEDYICELSDIGIDPDNMFYGMLDAITDMVEYHQGAIQRYDQFSSKLKQLLSTEHDRADEEEVDPPNS